MPNNIALVTKFQPLLDEVYKAASKTAILEAPASKVLFDGSQTVKVYKTSVQGLATHTRGGGFVTGDVTGAWESMTLAYDRSRSFSIDAMDNDETLEMAMGSLVGEFIRTKVVPEADAIRFAKMASASNILTTTGATLTSSTVIAALDAAILAMDEAEVPKEGRILFVTPTIYGAMKASTAFQRFVAAGQGLNRNFPAFDDMPVISVPQTRFYTAVTLYDGTTGGQEAGGYIKNSGSGKDINFMIVNPGAVLQVTKHVKPRIFTPDQNINDDAYKFDYRVYHDLFVYENKAAGIYLHKKA